MDAAAVPVVAVTAQQAVERAGQMAVRRSSCMAAAGSVGAYAVQLAHRAGARVIATAGAKDLGYVRGLGADVVVDYRSGRFEDVAHDVDAVLDFVGGETQRRSFAVLRRGGALVSAVSEPDQGLAAQHGVAAGFFLVEVTTERLTRHRRLIEAGALTTHVGAVLPLASARVAHEMLDGTRPRPVARSCCGSDNTSRGRFYCPSSACRISKTYAVCTAPSERRRVKPYRLRALFTLPETFPDDRDPRATQSGIGCAAAARFRFEILQPERGWLVLRRGGRGSGHD